MILLKFKKEGEKATWMRTMVPKFGGIVLERPQRTYDHKVAMTFKATLYKYGMLFVGVSFIHLDLRQHI